MEDREHIASAIKSAIAKTKRYPFLFVGSGLSRRYMGTPGWTDLLRGVCREVLQDDYAYARYYGNAKTAVERGEAISELPFTATLMENDVNKVLLTSERFSAFRETNDVWLQDGGSPLRQYVANVFDKFSLKRIGSSPLSEEVDLLINAGRSRISGVITTNYDRLCEELFPEFTPYVGESGLLFEDSTLAQEIYEIHGSISNPSSLVLTESDYAKFSDREKYLAAKLLTIFVEYPVIFIGYSMQDSNIQGILSSIAKCVGPDKLSKLQDRLIFIQYEDGNSGEIGPQIMSFDGQTLPMTNVTIEDFSPVYTAIADSEKLYEPKLLRELRNNIFSVVSKLDPKSQVIVSGIDRALDTLGENDRVVIGFGQIASQFGKSVKTDGLYRDIILDDGFFPPALVAYEYLEDLLLHNSSSVPVYKYLCGAGLPFSACGDVGNLLARYVEKYNSVASFRSATQRMKREKYRKQHPGVLPIENLLDREGKARAFQFVNYLDESEIDVHVLGAYLSDILHGTIDGLPYSILETGVYKSELKKCIRIYDYMKYRYGKPPGLC